MAPESQKRHNGGGIHHLDPAQTTFDRGTGVKGPITW